MSNYIPTEVEIATCGLKLANYAVPENDDDAIKGKWSDLVQDCVSNSQELNFTIILNNTCIKILNKYLSTSTPETLDFLAVRHLLLAIFGFEGKTLARYQFDEMFVYKKHVGLAPYFNNVAAQKKLLVLVEIMFSKEQKLTLDALDCIRNV